MAERLKFFKTRDRDPRTGAVEYEVWRMPITTHAQLLGRVELVATPSWRKAGRLRTSKRGYARHWRPLVPMGPGVDPFKRQVVRTISGSLYLAGVNTLGENSRGAAVELLVAWADHPELREDG